jgi:hypothetical protein
VPPKVAKDQTVKQQREARRAEKVAKLKAQQAKEKRNRILGISLASVAGIAIVALVVTFVVSSAEPKRDRASIQIEGVETWDNLDFNHVETPVDYEAQYGTTPPAGGSHNPAWLNCGVYTEPQQNVNAVHSLEHGAIWVTYDAAKLSEDDINTLRSKLPDSFVLVSPYVGLPSAIVASAWGAQLAFEDPADPRLGDFVEKYWQNPDLPEIGAPCTGAIDGPGKVA